MNNSILSCTYDKNTCICIYIMFPRSVFNIKLTKIYYNTFREAALVLALRIYSQCGLEVRLFDGFSEFSGLFQQLFFVAAKGSSTPVTFNRINLLYRKNPECGRKNKNTQAKSKNLRRIYLKIIYVNSNYNMQKNSKQNNKYFFRKQISLYFFILFILHIYIFFSSFFRCFHYSVMNEFSVYTFYFRRTQ